MPLPSKSEILRKAKAKAIERQVVSGLPSITPTEHELKETGTFQEARIDLMRVDQEALAEQERYLQEMAGEMRLKVIPLRELVALRRQTGYEYTNGWTKHKPKRRVPISVKPTVPKVKPKPAPTKKLKRILFHHKKKKRQRLHVGRNGKKPRKLKGFVFGDDVWKVRKPRKKRRKK